MWHLDGCEPICLIRVVHWTEVCISRDMYLVFGQMRYSVGRRIEPTSDAKSLRRECLHPVASFWLWPRNAFRRRQKRSRHDDLPDMEARFGSMRGRQTGYTVLLDPLLLLLHDC